MDGTFKFSPLQFTQLYTIHGLSSGRNVVGAYALLPDERMFQFEKYGRIAEISGAPPQKVQGQGHEKESQGHKGTPIFGARGTFLDCASPVRGFEGWAGPHR